MFRAALALIFCAALASFAYAFWLVLAPEGHNWSVDIPVERYLDRKQDQSTAAPDAAPPTAAPPAAESSAAEAPASVQPPAVATTDPAPAPSPAPAPPPAADDRPITLSLPIACTPGTDCWVVNYVDLDPGPGRRDYRCGEMSYDGHKGTDIGLANDAKIEGRSRSLRRRPAR